MESKVVEEEEKVEAVVETVDANTSIWQSMSIIQGMNIQIQKDKAAHGYRYATLDQIMEKLAPILHKHNLLVYHVTDWDPIEKMQYLKTTVMNVNEQSQSISSVTYLDSTVVLPGQNKVMVMGSMITYYRRYHVTSLFGLTTEEDTDAGGSLSNKGIKGKSPEAAGGGEKATDFVEIFKNMIAKGKTKEVVQKQFDNYKSKMTEEQAKSVEELITNIK